MIVTQIHIPLHLKDIAALPSESETAMFQLLASSGANIHAIFGLLLPRFQSVLPFFLSSVSSLRFIQFFIENSANNPREP